MARRAGAIAGVTGGRGAYVCVGGANSVEHLVAILAVLAAGDVWVPLNPRNGDLELARIVEFVATPLVLADAALAARVAREGIAIRPLDAPGADGPFERVPAAARSLDATQAIKFTGGTTGTPKGVQQPLRAWNTNIVTQRHELGLTADDRFLVGAPLTHGTSTYMLPVLGSGGTLVFPDGAGAEAILDAIAAHRATRTFGPPPLIQALAEAQATGSRDTSSLRFLLYGGAPNRPDQIGATRAAFGPILAATYGQTEAPQIATFLAPHELTGSRALSAGRATLLTEVAVLDGAGRPLGSGEEGEIALRGDLVMTGYLSAPAETAKVLVDGWLRTGDIGVVDEDGYVFIRDRLRDVIITGGFNVYPSDVEAVLAEDPDVADCSVVGIEDRKWGEAVHAAVQPREGATLDPSRLIARVRDALGAVKAPKQVHLFAALPRTPVGKIQKTAIRSEIIARMTADVH